MRELIGGQPVIPPGRQGELQLLKPVVQLAAECLPEFAVAGAITTDN